MSRYWHFEEDQFGMFVDVYPSEILDQGQDRFQVVTAVHCSGAPAEKVKWLKQFKDVGWKKKPSVIRRLSQEIPRGDFGLVVSRIAVASEAVAYANGLALLKDHEATASLFTSEGDAIVLGEEKIALPQAVSVAWYAIALGVIGISSTRFARAAGKTRSCLALDLMPQRPKLLMDLLAFVTENTALKALWATSALHNMQLEAQFGNAVAKEETGVKAKDSVMACVTDWIAASAGAATAGAQWVDGENRTEERRRDLADLVFQLKHSNQLEIRSLNAKITGWSEFAASMTVPG